MASFLLRLAAGVWAIGGGLACVWLSLTSRPAAYIAMAVYGLLAIGAIWAIARHEGRHTVRRIPSTNNEPEPGHDPIRTPSTQEQS